MTPHHYVFNAYTVIAKSTLHVIYLGGYEKRGSQEQGKKFTYWHREIMHLLFLFFAFIVHLQRLQGGVNGSSYFCSNYLPLQDCYTGQQ